MADNLTSQVRNIAQVATAVANGDLSKKIDVDARGEILELKTTLNTMVDTLSSFSSEVTRVAREVGSEGQLGGQARVEGVYGTWKRPDDQRQRAGPQPHHPGPRDRRGRQRRHPGRHVPLHLGRGPRRGRRAQGQHQPDGGQPPRDHPRQGLAGVQPDPYRRSDAGPPRSGGGRRPDPARADAAGERAGRRVLPGRPGRRRHPSRRRRPPRDWRSSPDTASRPSGHASTPAGMPGHGLVARRPWRRSGSSSRTPRRTTSRSTPGSVPRPRPASSSCRSSSRTAARRDRAGLVQPVQRRPLAFIDQFVHTIGVSINTIIANARTESLLSESQRLPPAPGALRRAQRQQDELQRSNAELEEKAALLATSSQYKSEFLANMSHELRTPLNSLLILARLLADNPDGHLSDQEVEFATTIHRSGSDLLQLINDILDLSKVEAGRMDVRPKKLPLTKLLDYVHATFRPMTIDRGLAFEIAVGEDVPRELFSDEQRLQQILRNLLSNAVKFTSSGGVELRVERASTDFDEETAARARRPHRLRGHGHRHRHRAGETAGDLRGVPAVRRHHQPQVRRHRPRPVHQPGDRGAARRPDHRRERAGRRLHLHAVRPRRSTPAIVGADERRLPRQPRPSRTIARTVAADLAGAPRTPTHMPDCAGAWTTAGRRRPSWRSGSRAGRAGC